jgi:hypothetical protein
MITTASNFYAASLICDEAIPAVSAEDTAPAAFLTSDRFHKLFLKAGGFGLEFDLNADPHYDASGLGRLHRAGAPSALCLSMPSPETPNFTVDTPNPAAMSLCPADKTSEGWVFAADPSAVYEAAECAEGGQTAAATLSCTFGNRTVMLDYTVSAGGVSITQRGEGMQYHTLPVLSFDGEASPAAEVSLSCMTVAYEGHLCRYTTNGEITDTGITAANRNGRYKVFCARACGRLHIQIEII